MTKKEHNGWTNYETWLVNLWLSNEQVTLDHWQAEAAAAFEAAQPDRLFTKLERASLLLSGSMKDYHEQAANLTVQNSLFADLLNSSLSEVNWGEIANNLIETATQQIK